MQKLRSSPALSFIIVSFVIWIAVSLRWILEFIEQSHPYLWLLSVILAVYGILLGFQPFTTKGSPLRAHIYLAIQTALIIGAMLLYFELDFFALLFLPLGGQAMFLFPRKTAFAWIAIFGIAIIIGQTIQFGWPGGLSFTFLYLAGLFFVASFSTLMMRADEARIQSNRLLDELQRAHRKLQEYAGQAEELATAKERNRLARELHDSVAQTLYGLTLQAEAASRQLKTGQTEEVASYLREIRESSQQTLQETRLLIFELRPPILEEEGLASALRARLESVENRSGLKVQIDLQEVGRLPNGIESGLYGISNEVLNNILKHAHAREIRVSLKKRVGKIILEINDNGIGFDLDSAEGHGGLGLKGMRERAEQINADLRISSGENGTQISVEVAYE
ncbi:MAG: sensor histidine kinase [Anaerolineales bacterium]